MVKNTVKSTYIKFSIIAFFFLSMQFIFAQHKTRADRFFEKGDYINAAKYYELQLQKKYHKKDIENIAISYYNIFEYEDAAYFLKDLVQGNFDEEDKTYDNKFNFMYHQVQAALGNYESGLRYLKKYYKNLGKDLIVDDAIAKVEEIRLKNPDYTIKSVKFNSNASDFGAVKRKDTVFFVSDRSDKKLWNKNYKWTHKPFLDIYKVQVNEKLDTVGTIQKLPEIINSKLHEGNFCITKDGNTMYISRSVIINGKKQFDSLSVNQIHLFKTSKIDGKWQKLEELPFNKKEFSYQHPALSPNEDKLYFSSNQSGGYGSYDIYYVTIDNDNFGQPVNLGEVINTPNREHFPFISQEGNLFFSSNGHLGLGMLDNFVSEKIDGKFTKPINLGVPINSKYDDFNINYYAKTKGFFASNRKDKNDDIYAFEQIGEIFLREYITTFEIRDTKTNNYIPNVTATLLDDKDKVVYNNTLDSLSHFSNNLLPGKYRLKASSEGYIKDSKTIRVVEKQNQKYVLYLTKKPEKVIPPPKPPKPINPIDKLVKEKGIDKNLKQTDPKRFKLLTDTKGPSIVEKNGKLYFKMPPIYFDFDMWNIREDSKLVLKELAQKLERYPNVKIKISAFTDSRGTKMYNQVLSERRAESTRNYLALELFINARRLKFEGFGESKPIVPCEIPSNCTEEEHQKNRRCEFEIIDY